MRPRHATPRWASSRLLLGAMTLLVTALAAAIAPPPAAAGATTFSRTGDIATLTNGAATVRYDLRLGTMDLDMPGGAAVRRAYAAAEVRTPAGVRSLRGFAATKRTIDQERFTGPLGRGLRLTVANSFSDPSAALTQTITLLDDKPYVLLRVTVGRAAGAGGDPVATNQIEALAAGGMTTPPGSVALRPAADARLYRAPFDNDGDFAVPRAAESQGALSYWLTALFDAAGGAGLVAGATETRTWKSAAWFDGPTGSLSLFSGVRTPADIADHGVRYGDTVSSAEFLVGGYRDYRDGLADLMATMAVREAPLAAPSLPAPIGWNPWYQYDFRADEGMVRAIADYIAAGPWAGLGYRYVNLDAGWNVTDGDWRANPERFPSGMSALTSYIHGRGLLAGSYFIPFAVAPDLLNTPIPGTPYLFRDAVVKDDSGQPLHAHILDWEYVLDTTHPGALTYLRTSAAGIAADGFDFVKLDFLHIGTQEGRRYDPSATGMEAFGRGMAVVRDTFAAAGRPIYLSAAISPLYVHQYVHARRTGTDVNFGQARTAQNVALSWFTDLLYHRNDPDNVVVREDWFPQYGDSLARMHATMAALGGTVFILGDDPRYLSPKRAALLMSPEILALAREGVAARPLDVSETPAPVWSARARDGSVVVGLFNWGDKPVRRSVSLARLGLDTRHPYPLRDLWNPRAGRTATGAITVELAPQSAALYRVGP